MYRCSRCGQSWDDNRARDNERTCTRRCSGQLVMVEPLALPDLDGCDFNRLPYPVALTARRLADALQTSSDVLKSLFLLKDCFEATIKYFGAVLLAEYRRSPACTPERTEVLLKSMVRPSLGTWVGDVVRPLSLWLIADQSPPGSLAVALFAELPAKPGSKPAESALLQRCKQFVTYRNDALGHGAQRRDSVYESDLAQWLPLVRQLLDGVAGLAGWRLCLVTAVDRCRVWLGPQPGTATEPGSFSETEIGHFVLRGPGGAYRDLYPFLCYLPDSQQENRLHYYDSLYRYQATKKEATVLEYDHGERHPRPEPVAGLEEAFTVELLVKAFKWHRGRMEIIEGRVANFGELIDAHAAIVGRQFVIDHVRNFWAEHDRGLLVIEAQPGKGKTALMAHLIEEVFGHYAPSPVHFFYRRTAGITDPAVCVKSLYHALLQAHGITEAEESKQKNSPEEVFIKLANLLSQEIAPRLLPGRPQLLFIDALDEAAGNAFQRIPENLPAGVYVIATTRPVSDRTVLARRQNLHWYDLDAPDLLQENLRDGFEYVHRELVGAELPNETVAEIARIGAGNFLVLKLLCQHLRTTLPPDQVAAFLRRLATDGGKDQLGFIYAEFWERMTERCTREDVNLLCDVAGVLVTAHAPLTADMVCGVLSLPAGDWDFALRHLAEYLTVVNDEVDRVRETFYRIYHESFADFLRAKAEADRSRFCNRLADYCLNWSRLPEGYGRLYALRFGPRHLREVGRGEEAAALLLDVFFLEAKTEAAMVFELASDFTAVAPRLSEPDRRLELIEEAIRRDIHFIAEHPTTLFQCLWNSCWWYDSSESVGSMDSIVVPSPKIPVGEQQVGNLSRLLTAWHEQRRQVARDRLWLRSLCPPFVSLGQGPVRVLSGHTLSVTCSAWSPDGLRVASGSSDGTIRIWEVQTGKEFLVIDIGRLTVMGVTWSPDGRRIAGCGIVGDQVGTTDLAGKVRDASEEAAHVVWGTWYIWDALTGVELVHFAGHAGEVCAIAWSPNGGRLAMAGVEDCTVRIWDAVSGHELARCDHQSGLDPNHVGSVAWSPDGRQVAARARLSPIRVFDAESGRELAAIHGQLGGTTGVGSKGCVAWSSDGTRLAYANDLASTIQVYSLSRRQQVACWKGHGPCVSSMAWSPDSMRLATASDDDTTIRVWDASSGTALMRFDWHWAGVNCVAWAPDGSRILSGSDDGSVCIWDPDRSPNHRPPGECDACVGAVVWSPDGASLGIRDGTVLRVYDVFARREKASFKGHEGRIAFAWAPDSAQLVTIDEARILRVCCVLVSDRPVLTMEGVAGYEDTIGSLEGPPTWSPDGRFVACGGMSDPSIYVWDTVTGRSVAHLDNEGELVNELSWSVDGNRLISNTGSWDCRTWSRIRPTTEELQSSGSSRIKRDMTSLAPNPLGMIIDLHLPNHVRLHLPMDVKNLTPHPSGRMWAGSHRGQLVLFALEGDGCE